MGAHGIGMPAALMLEDFACHVAAVFGVGCVYQVGSSLVGTTWRDVDIRVILSDDDWAAWELGDPERTHDNEKWVALVFAFSALGKQMTGLPIDFQIQPQSLANEKFAGRRNAIGLRRFRKELDHGDRAIKAEEGTP